MGDDRGDQGCLANAGRAQRSAHHLLDARRWNRPIRHHRVRARPAVVRQDDLPRVPACGVGPPAANRRARGKYHRRTGLGPHRAELGPPRGSLGRGTRRRHRGFAGRDGADAVARESRLRRVRIPPMEATRKPTEPILHADLDAFYASVETLKDPSLAGKPVVVGSAGPRGVVMSASYAARARGLRSAMPSMRARRLCPEAIFVPPDFEAYRAYSNRFREVLMSFTPIVEPISLDEAFLDVSGATTLFGPPPEIAARIRATVQGDLSLTCSVGVGPTKLVAKLGSTAAKPDGVIVVRAGEVIDFLHPLPVRALWGVGEKTAETLDRLAIRLVGDVARTPAPILERVLGEGQAATLRALASGEDARIVVPFEAPKSVSHEETYPRDLDDPDEIRRQILDLSHRVASRL